MSNYDFPALLKSAAFRLKNGSTGDYTVMVTFQDGTAYKYQLVDYEYEGAQLNYTTKGE